MTDLTSRFPPTMTLNGCRLLTAERNAVDHTSVTIQEQS